MIPVRRRTKALAAAVALLGVLFVALLYDRLVGNVPVQFYGRVVDEKGVGIPGVHVTAELVRVKWTTIYWAPKYSEERLEVLTDRDGRFAFTSPRGKVLTLNSFESDGWRLKVGAPGDPGPPHRVFDYPRGGIGPPPPTDRAKPYVFKMVPKAKTPATGA